MKKKLLWLLGLAIPIGLAIAQPVITQNLSGNEVVLFQTGGPGGTGGFTPTYVLRNGTGYTTVAAGATVNTTVPNTASKVVALGAITTWNITMPLIPFDGQTVAVACPGGTATVSMIFTPPTSPVGSAFTACTLGGVAANTAEWVYSSSTATWIRIQ